MHCHNQANVDVKTLSKKQAEISWQFRGNFIFRNFSFFSILGESQRHRNQTKIPQLRRKNRNCGIFCFHAGSGGRTLYADNIYSVVVGFLDCSWQFRGKMSRFFKKACKLVNVNFGLFFGYMGVYSSHCGKV